MLKWNIIKGGVALAALSTAMAVPAYAQVTTSAIRGTVSDDTGAPISGANVVVTHTPSGTTSTAVTNDSGTFSARGLRVGGPYTVEVAGGDFQPVTITDIYVQLDQTYALPVTVSGQRTLDAIVVTAPQMVSAYMDTGVSTSLSLEELQAVASINRDITDAAELDPFASVNIQSGGAKELSISGANSRFNSITIDGVKLNDRFGLNANGYPTQRSPISFDAIESLQIESAPYDTEFNGFTGGTINAVTKSGTNEFHGSAYYYETSDNWAGKRLGDRDINRDFENNTWGATLGGPILKDRLFFFAAYDKYEEAASLNRGPLGSGALNEATGVTTQDIADITNIMTSTYGFDPLAFTGGVPPVEDEKILASLDWNITNTQRAKFTYILTEGAQILEQSGNAFVGPSADLGFPSDWYENSERVESFIGHLFSDWTPNFSTELKIAKTTQATGQDSLGGAEFPLFVIDTPNGGTIALGPDTFRHGNELDQEFMQYKLAATYVLGDHTFKAGIEREEVDVDNLFALGSEGMYYFSSFANLQAGIADEFYYENAVTNNEDDRRAIWGFNVNSLYLQDSWDIDSANLTLMGGLRYDWYEAEGTIRENQNFIDRYGYSNTGDIDGLDVIMPRFAFNWDPTSNITVRGGLGRFSGGSPGVWISNSYSNDGIIADSVSDYGGNVPVPFTPDAATGQYVDAVYLNQLASGSPDGSVNALSPDFEIPTTWKANVGVAYNVDFGSSEDWTFSADVLYNKLENAPFWYREDCAPASAAPDGRVIYDCESDPINPGSDAPEAIIVGSTDKGESMIYALSVDKEFDNGISLRSSYTYQDIEDIGMGTSSTATSNYSDNPRYDLQVPTVGSSNFEVEHQFKLRLDWEKEFVQGFPTKVSLFGTRRSGQPYSYTFNENNACVFDVFGGRCDRESRVDDAGHLFYVPSGPNDPLFSAGSFGGDAAQQAAFFDYIDNSELSQYKGGIADRNGDNSRWSTIIDMRFQQQFPGVLKGHRSFFFVDIENLGNLINDDWGHITRTRYEYERAVASAQIVNGQFEYSDLRSDSSIKNLETLTNSLWQIQLGIKYEF
ncbi:MAG: cell envelope biogenesis protein OmpA [Ponticaulis sp.]|nr:cell envelope biogenesis protein OmpA [Ponticaulis sp.]